MRGGTEAQFWYLRSFINKGKTMAGNRVRTIYAERHTGQNLNGTRRTRKNGVQTSIGFKGGDDVWDNLGLSKRISNVRQRWR